jgi:hypothetical protein
MTHGTSAHYISPVHFAAWVLAVLMVGSAPLVAQEPQAGATGD